MTAPATTSAPASPRPVPRLVIPAVAGDPLYLEKPDPRPVVDAACSAAVPRAFVCLTCRVRLPTELYLMLHLEAAGLGSSHVVARWCPRHDGPEAL